MKKTNLMTLIVGRFLPLIALYLLYGYCCQRIVCAQNRQIVIPDSPRMISDQHSPMEYTAELLEQMYLTPVTYEAPILNWIGDTGQVPNSIGEMIIIPKRRSFAMPDEANPRKTPTLSAELLKRIVDGYQEQTDGPRFRIESSRWGFHIIPDQVRNQRGQFVEAITFLDAFVTVPMEKRTPSGHFEAICDAVNASTVSGIELHCHTPYLEGYFSQESLSRIPTDEEMLKTLFVWGIERVTARDALIDLFEQSATTLTWRLLCDTQPLCVLNIVPMVVNYMGSDGKPIKAYQFQDRKKGKD